MAVGMTIRSNKKILNSEMTIRSILNQNSYQNLSATFDITFNNTTGNCGSDNRLTEGKT